MLGSHPRVAQQYPTLGSHFRVPPQSLTLGSHPGVMDPGFHPMVSVPPFRYALQEYSAFCSVCMFWYLIFFKKLNCCSPSWWWCFSIFFLYLCQIHTISGFSSTLSPWPTAFIPPSTPTLKKLNWKYLSSRYEVNAIDIFIIAINISIITISGGHLSAQSWQQKHYNKVWIC